MEEHNPSTPTVKRSHKISHNILLYSLYFLLLLMVFFSLLAIRNAGEEGYERCVQKKCEQKGDAFCSKAREIANCCAGAGGNLGMVNDPNSGSSKYTCVFN
ncbi:MAG: hypothetical protein AABX31_05360 [Nanoarchaeota archaeon]